MSVKEEIFTAIPTPVERLMDDLDQQVRSVVGQSLYACQTEVQIDRVRKVLLKVNDKRGSLDNIAISSVSFYDDGNGIVIGFCIIYDGDKDTPLILVEENLL